MADKTELSVDRGRGEETQDSGQCGEEPRPGDATLSRGPRSGPGGSRHVSPPYSIVNITEMNFSSIMYI